jgi:hypothetical protein
VHAVRDHYFGITPRLTMEQIVEYNRDKGNGYWSWHVKAFTGASDQTGETNYYFGALFVTLPA